MSDFFLSDNFQFLVVKFSMYLNRRVFEMLVAKVAAKLVYLRLAAEKGTLEHT